MSEPQQPSPEPAAAMPGDSVEVLEEDDEGKQPAVSEPTKLMRIAVMLREMQEEVRRADPDEAGRHLLKTVQERAFAEMRSVLSEDLQAELDELIIPFDGGVPSESEIRIAQAQLIGWLEGLFQGIQAAIFNQQLQARQQLEHMRGGRGLPPGAPAPGGQGAHEGQRPGTGQYL